MATMEMKSAISPTINLLGNEYKKSCSLKRDVRIDKKTNIEVEENKNAIESDIKNTRNELRFTEIGIPFD